MVKKSIKLNYIYNVVYQAVTMLIQLITTPYLARVLGADGIGTYSFAESIVSYFVLFATLGVGIFGQREVSYAQEDRERRSAAFWSLKAFSCITTMISLLAYIVIVILNYNNSTIFLILIMNIVAVVLDISWLYQGMEEFGLIMLRNFIIRICHLIYIFTFVKTKEDLVIYVFGIALVGVLGNISLWFGHNKYVDRVPLKDVHPFKYVKGMLQLFVPTIASQVYLVADKTMIGFITNNSFENGYYDQAIKLSRVALAIITASAVVILPRMGHYFEEKDQENVNALLNRSYRFVFFLGLPLCLGLIGAASQFVPWFYGDGYDKVVTLLQITSFLIPVIGINSITGGMYMIATKRENLYTASVILGAVVNLLLNMFLITLFSSVGAAFASLAAETSIMVVQFVMLRDEISILPALKSSWKYYVSTAAMFALLCFEKTMVSNTFLGTVILMLSCVLVYGVLLLVLRDSFFLENVYSIKNRFLGARNHAE